MLWTPCVRIDLPVDAWPEHVEVMAGLVDELIQALEQGGVSRVNMAFSAAALRAFGEQGHGPLLERTRTLAEDGRIEMLSTAAHGALLPLLPAAELERQITLNDCENRRWFGDGYRPQCLWPPVLAASQKVAEVASGLDFTGLLVDEAALRVWPGEWEGDRIDAAAQLPGFFLLPCSRRGSYAFALGGIRSDRELERYVPHSSSALLTYLITAVDLRQGLAPHLSLFALADRVRTARTEDLYVTIPLSRTTSLLPCSRRSTAEEISSGLPFAAWFRPGDERQGLKWHLMTKLVQVLDQLETRGLGATPAFVTLRETLDVCWRESWWRDVVEGRTDPLQQLMRAVENLDDALAAEDREELAETGAALGPSGRAVSLGSAAPVAGASP